MTDPATPQGRFDAGDGDETWLEDAGTGTGASAGDSAGGSAVWWLLVAAVGLVVSAAVLNGGVALQVLGYLTASLLLFTAVAWYRRRSIERAAKLGIGASRSLNFVALGLLVCGFVLSLIHAWNIAIHFS